MATREINATGVKSSNIVYTDYAGTETTIATPDYVHTTWAAAYAAAAGGDILVFTNERQVAGGGDAAFYDFAKAISIYAANNVRGDKSATLTSGVRFRGRCNASVPCNIGGIRFINLGTLYESLLINPSTTGAYNFDSLVFNHDADEESLKVYSGSASVTANITNCFFYGDQSGSDIAIDVNGAQTVNIFNCSIYNYTTGIDGLAGTTVQNTVITDCGTTCYSGTFEAASDNNIDDDGTAPGTTTSTVSGWADYYTSQTDLHCKDATTCNTYAGTDKSDSFDHDIDGAERTSWTVGADFIQGAGGGGGGNVNRSGLHLRLGLGL